MTNDLLHITESHLINRFGLLSCYECSLISAFFFLCVTLVEKYRLQSLRRFTRITTQPSLSYTEQRAIHFLAVINTRTGKQTQPITLPQVTSAFTCGCFWAWITNRRQTGPESRPLFYFPGVFHQLPIKVYFPVQCAGDDCSSEKDQHTFYAESPILTVCTVRPWQGVWF